MSSFEQHLIENMARGFIDYRIIPRLYPDGRLEIGLINQENGALKYYRVQGNELIPRDPDQTSESKQRL